MEKSAPDNIPSSVSKKQLAAAYGINRVTLYKWCKRIPGFYQALGNRRIIARSELEIFVKMYGNPF